MTALAKATLQAISADRTPRPLGDAVPVQFNPATLRLTMANRVEGGTSTGAQARQYLGTGSTVLALDLVFDTADEGTTDRPVSVRERTALVEQFVLPRGQRPDKQAPPRVRFSWGEFVLDGVIESITVDLDLFAASGVPLRAKVALSIKQQDARFELLEAGPGANRAPAGGPALGRPGAGSLGPAGPLGLGLGLGVGAGVGAALGALGSLRPDRSVAALGGESAADLAARAGLDPAAWRGVAAPSGVESPLSLPAGAELPFRGGAATAAPGLGQATGATAGTGAPPPASRDPVEQGLALAAQGGLAAALAGAEQAVATQAAAAARAAFGAPAAAAPAGPDPRAATFGLGVPLRTRIGPEASERAGRVAGTVVVGPRDPSPAAPAAGPRGHDGSCDCGCGGRR